MTFESHQSNLTRYDQPDPPMGMEGDGTFATSGRSMAGSGAGAEPPTESLWRMVDDRLRGRWRWMVLIAAVLGTGLAVAGWRSTGPMYESLGVIRVTPTVPVFLPGQIEEPVNFPMFVNTQVQLLKSRRVLENAMNDPKIQAFEWSKQEDALADLEEDLQVSSDRNTELIFVSYEAESPEFAQTVVNAVINSYDQIHGRAGGNEVGRKLERLREYEAGFRRELRRVSEELEKIQARYGTGDLEGLQAMKVGQLESTRQLIAMAESELTVTQTGEATSVTGPMLARLEELDPKLRELRIARDVSQMDFENIKSRWRSNSPPYKRAQEAAELADTLYQQQFVLSLELWDQVRDEIPPGSLVGPFDGMSPERLQTELQRLRQEEERLLQDSMALIVDVELLKNKRYEEAEITSNLAATTKRIQDLNREEENIAGRISIEQPGYRPRVPSSDSRARRAAFGLTCGAALSFGLFFLLGTIDRRAFGASQLRQITENGRSPVLGVLPDLGRSMLDPESSDMASHCVHQIRNQIESQRGRRGRGYVLALSSPFQGDGKTSIVLSLGWSYAVAGYRVLLVDCDMVGRSLSRQVGMGDHPGTKEAILGAPVQSLIQSLPVENLQLLPAGLNGQVGPETIKKLDLEHVFDVLRENFDVILVDTGPLLGSLESIPVAATADAVVLTVRRGRSRSRLEECVDRLHGVGVPCLGVILNCAARAECYRYVSETSLAPPEETRARRAVQPFNQPSLIDDSEGEKNALVLAMEMTSRQTTTDE